MKADEFLSYVTYSTNEHKNCMTVWWKNQVIADIAFDDVPHKLENDEYCEELAEEVAIESNLFNKLVKEEK